MVCLSLMAGAPRMAAACGGFFCNQPDSPFNLPVAQTAENVLFAMERAPSGQFRLEAHVQIFYTGPADRFSWIVPVDSKPTLDVGADRVFSVLESLTRPQFNVEWTTEGKCQAWFALNPATGSAAPAVDAGAARAGDGGVTVAFRGDVGPYDAAILKSDDPADPKPLLSWLETNKYFVSPEAAKLIGDYVRQEKHFVAIRLLNDKSTNEIKPLVMRFEGPGPCIPLKLTAIASIRDLRVNLWVLAPNRVVPENFFEITVNEAAIDWAGGGRNYGDLLKRAADEAGGNAFTTEYAGPTSILRESLYREGMYKLDPIRLAETPAEAMEQLMFQPFPRDSQLLNVLRKHIPLPEVLRRMGVSEQQFYNAVGFYWAMNPSAFAPFSGQAFAADLEAQFVTPLKSVQALFDKHPKLTRLATFISPEEMNADPTFVLNPTLPDVPAVRTARGVRMCGDNRYSICQAPVRLTLPSGGTMWLPPGSGCGWTTAMPTLEKLPALAVGYQRDQAGEGVARFDNRNSISAMLIAHNGVVMKSLLTGANEGGLLSPVMPVNPRMAPSPLDETSAPGSVRGSCSCDLGGAPVRGGGWAGLAVLALLWWRRRR